MRGSQTLHTALEAEEEFLELANILMHKICISLNLAVENLENVPLEMNCPAMRTLPTKAVGFVTGILLAGLAGILTHCAPSPPAGGGSEAAGDGKVRVFVSVLPQKAIVERIGGEHVVVDSMVTAGGDPHSFSATAKQMVALGHADIYMTTGMPFEGQYLPKIQETRPDLIVESMLMGIDLMEMDPHHHHDEPNGNAANAADDTHDHDHAHDHEGEGDPHAWLSPGLLKVMAWNVSNVLSEADPEHAEEFEANLVSFDSELDEIDARIRSTLAPHKDKEFYVFHPAFGYFAEAYGLEQVAVETGGQKPSPKQLADLIKKMREAEAKVRDHVCL